MTTQTRNTIAAALLLEAERGFAFGAEGEFPVEVSHTERSGHALYTRHGEAIAFRDETGAVCVKEVSIF